MNSTHKMQFASETLRICWLFTVLHTMSCYMLIATNLDDIRNKSKKLIPDDLINKLAEVLYESGLIADSRRDLRKNQGFYEEGESQKLKDVRRIEAFLKGQSQETKAEKYSDTSNTAQKMERSLNIRKIVETVGKKLEKEYEKKLQNLRYCQGLLEETKLEKSKLEQQIVELNQENNKLQNRLNSQLPNIKRQISDQKEKNPLINGYDHVSQLQFDTHGMNKDEYSHTTKEVVRTEKYDTSEYENMSREKNNMKNQKLTYDKDINNSGGESLIPNLSKTKEYRINIPSVHREKDEEPQSNNFKKNSNNKLKRLGYSHSSIPLSESEITQSTSIYSEENLSKPPKPIKARTESLWIDDKDLAREETAENSDEANISTVKLKISSMRPTRDRYKFSTPNYYEKLPRIAEVYNFNEPIPVQDQLPEDLTFKAKPKIMFKKRD